MSCRLPFWAIIPELIHLFICFRVAEPVKTGNLPKAFHIILKFSYFENIYPAGDRKFEKLADNNNQERFFTISGNKIQNKAGPGVYPGRRES
jgi:hypothetical protein